MSIKPIFKQDKVLGLKAFTFIIIAIILMIADRQSAMVHSWRNKLSIIVEPFEYIINWPIQGVTNIATDLSTQHTLLNENAKLKAQILLMQAQMQQMLAIQNENAQLKQLLQSSTKANGRVLQAQILAVSPDPYLHQIAIDRGVKDGVYVGQPVLDPSGIIGQVVQTGELSSRVLLLTDESSAIPVQDSRSGVRAIAEGNAESGMLQLANITQTMDIKPGDLLITSGLDQQYPYGYPVAVIKNIQPGIENQFLKVTAEPTAKIDSSRLFILVWPEPGKIDPSISAALTGQSSQPSKKGEQHEK